MPRFATPQPVTAALLRPVWQGGMFVQRRGLHLPAPGAAHCLPGAVRRVSRRSRGACSATSPLPNHAAPSQACLRRTPRPRQWHATRAQSTGARSAGRLNASGRASGPSHDWPCGGNGKRFHRMGTSLAARARHRGGSRRRRRCRRHLRGRRGGRRLLCASPEKQQRGKRCHHGRIADQLPLSHQGRHDAHLVLHRCAGSSTRQSNVTFV